MSLHNLLLWHFFTIETNEAVINQDGALNRKLGWIRLYENLNGNLQTTPINRNDEVLDFAKKELEVRHILFHKQLNKEISTNKRILIHKDARKKITDWGDVGNIRIFNIVSIKEPVILNNKRLELGELHLEELITKRQTV